VGKGYERKKTRVLGKQNECSKEGGQVRRKGGNAGGFKNFATDLSREKREKKPLARGVKSHQGKLRKKRGLFKEVGKSASGSSHHKTRAREYMGQKKRPKKRKTET